MTRRIVFRCGSKQTRLLRGEVKMTEAERTPAADENASRSRPLLRRTGCALGVLVWAVLMLIPFLLFALAVRGEISVDTGSAPEQRLRVWLIMEAAQRGIGVSTAAAYETGDTVCVQTDVRFLLWQGTAEAPQTFCECYTRGAGGVWQAAGATAGACPARETTPGRAGTE